MVLIREFRIVMPLTVEQYQVGQLFSVAEASKAETGGGEGIEVVKNEPYDDPKQFGEKGQYTNKIYHLQSKAPKFIQLIAPKGSLEIYEEAWNAYPKCKTVITNPEFMKENFILKIETIHAPNDRGDQENIHGLNKDQLKQRKVVKIDIANDKVEKNSYKKEEDPKLFKSKTGVGPLGEDWIKTQDPVMCCYKLVTIEFKWWGLQSKVESYTQKLEQRIFLNFHRQVFCSMDKWVDMNMDDIRKMEEETKKELEAQIKSGEIRGTKE